MLAMPADSPAERLPARLRARRKTLGVSQETAAARAGVTLRTWQRWEEGGPRGNLARLADMAVALETTAEELLGTGDPRGVRDLSMEDRLARIESTQAAILQTLQQLRATFADPREVLREADALLDTKPPESED